jgi:hypothetical protein
MNCDISMTKQYSYSQIIDKFINCDNIYKIEAYMDRVTVWMLDETTKVKTIMDFPVKRSKKAGFYNYTLTFDKGWW